MMDNESGLAKESERLRVIQISSCRTNNVPTTQCDFITTALCQDGTVWQIRNGAHEWFMLPEIKIKKKVK